MGGERETVMQAKSTDKIGQEHSLGSIRFHQSGDEIHFHDDHNHIKVAIPAGEMHNAWNNLSSGKKKKFKYKDLENHAELRIRLVESADSSDIRIELRKLKKKESFKTSDYLEFERFING